jgi:uncharacterized protein (TIGR02001 family)
LAAPSPVAAQVGAAVSFFTDNRFRGYSLSDGRPVATLDVSYDAPSGLYGNISGSMVATRHDGLRPLGVQLNGGYAKRLSSGLTVDAGVIHSNYFHYASREPRSYNEVYVGIAGKVLSSRIYVSPDYLGSGDWTIYGEADANVPVARKLRLTGHAGVLAPLNGRDYYDSPYRLEIDWRLGIARDFGPVTAEVSWSGIGRARDLYQERSYRRRALVLGVTYVL